MEFKLSKQELDYIADRIVESMMSKTSSTNTPVSNKKVETKKSTNNKKSTKKCKATKAYKKTIYTTTFDDALRKSMSIYERVGTLITRLSRVSYHGTSVCDLPIAEIRNISKKSFLNAKGIGPIFTFKIEKTLRRYGLNFGDDVLDNENNYDTFVA